MHNLTPTLKNESRRSNRSGGYQVIWPRCCCQESICHLTGINCLIWNLQVYYVQASLLGYTNSVIFWKYLVCFLPSIRTWLLWMTRNWRRYSENECISCTLCLCVGLRCNEIKICELREINNVIWQNYLLFIFLTALGKACLYFLVKLNRNNIKIFPYGELKYLILNQHNRSDCNPFDDF